MRYAANKDPRAEGGREASCFMGGKDADIRQGESPETKRETRDP